MRSVRLYVLIAAMAVLSGCKDDDAPSAMQGLPPDPGLAGKATLAGVDVDSDGVRDDLEIAIHARAATNPALQEAMSMQAKALQQAMVAGESGDSSTFNAASEQIGRAVGCLATRTSDPSTELAYLELHAANTPERSAAYRRFNEASDGQFFGAGDDSNSCD